MRHGTLSGFLSGCDCRACKRAFVRWGRDQLARRRNAGVEHSSGEWLAEILVEAELANY